MTADRLRDWGEFRLLREVIFPALHGVSVPHGLGDDVGYVSFPGLRGQLVVTSDAGPRPLAFDLIDNPFWSWGWYAVLANVSDLASAGATPVAFTSSVEAPDDMPVSDFRSAFEGMAAACHEFGIPNAGGNIKTGPRFCCHGTAIGAVPSGSALTRRGCRPGDAIVAIGECGRFIACYQIGRAHV